MVIFSRLGRHRSGGLFGYGIWPSCGGLHPTVAFSTFQLVDPGQEAGGRRDDSWGRGSSALPFMLRQRLGVSQASLQNGVFHFKGLLLVGDYRAGWPAGSQRPSRDDPIIPVLGVVPADVGPCKAPAASVDLIMEPTGLC